MYSDHVLSFWISIHSKSNPCDPETIIAVFFPIFSESISRMAEFLSYPETYISTAEPFFGTSIPSSSYPVNFAKS